MLRDYDLQNSFITSYEWRTLQSQQWTGYAEAVTGFLKIDTGNLESILKISGKHGVFFIEHLAQTRPSDVIEWIPQEKDEDDMDYFARVTSDAHKHTVVKDAATWGSVCPKVLCQQAPEKPMYGKPAAFPASGRLACRPLGLQSTRLVVPGETFDKIILFCL